MAEWRLFRGWSSEALEQRFQQLADAGCNFAATEAEMTVENGWNHYHSDAVIARNADDEHFERARVALANYRFSSPNIVVAHFDPESELLTRRILLEIKVLGLHYLCPALVSAVRDEADAYGFRYDTLDGHIERGMEWFLLSRHDGELRFRIEARWMHGDLPNWWSRAGFTLLAPYYQRRWHRAAHQRMSVWAQYGTASPPRSDASGLTHQGVDVTFTYYSKRKRPT